jgi:NTE family protein
MGFRPSLLRLYEFKIYLLVMGLAFVMCFNSEAHAREFLTQSQRVGSGAASVDADLRGQVNRPKIGLVLSGGSAKGLAHVGVLKVFEAEGIPIDIITGTSMGAIAGGLYALGYNAEQLEAFVTDRDWQSVFTDAVRRTDQDMTNRVSGQGVLVSLPTQGTEIKIPSGVISGQEVMALLSEWTWSYQEDHDFSTFPIPFAVVATNLKTGQEEALTDVSLPLALRASMSIPTLFAPVDIDGVKYVDGGLSRNIPAIDAIDLGASVLIGIDVSTIQESMNLDEANLIDVMLHTATYQGIRSDVRQRALLDLIIRPNLSGLAATDFSAATEWIARGEAAARAALPRIRQMLDSLDVPLTQRERSFRSFQAKFVDSLVVKGVVGVPKELVEKRLDLALPTSLTPETIRAAISQVYATGLFDLVTYHFTRLSDESMVLNVEVTPKKTEDNVGLGIRYDSENDAQILVTMALRNRLSYGSITEFRVSLGKQSQVRALFLSPNGVDSRISMGASMEYAHAPIRFFLPDKYARSVQIEPTVPVLSLGLDVYTFGLWGGFVLAPNTVASLAVKTDIVRVGREVAATSDPTVPIENDLITIKTEDHSVFVTTFGVERDTYNNRSFPTQGMKLDAKAGVGSSNAEPSLTSSAQTGSSTFKFFRFDVGGYVPITRTVSGFGRTAFSFGAGEALPLSYFSFLGGVRPINVLPGVFFPFYGLASQARFGRKAYFGAVGVQWEVKKDMFARFILNAGGTYDLLLDQEKTKLGSDEYDLLKEKRAVGFGFELGLRTPLGPATIIFSTSESGVLPDVGLSIGYAF